MLQIVQVQADAGEGLRRLQGDSIAEELEKKKGRREATFYSVSFSKPNPVWFGKVMPKNCVRFPNQFQFDLERKKLILQDADSKPNSDWFGKC